MKNGTQSEMIEKMGGRAAFEKLDALELSMLCGMYATSGKINTYIDCAEVFVRRFKDSTDAATHFMVVNTHEGLALSLNGLGRYSDANQAIDRGLEILEEKNLRDHSMYGEMIRTAEIELHGFKAVIARQLGDARTEQESLQFVDNSMPWLDDQVVELRQKTRKILAQVYFSLEDYDKAADLAKKLPPDPEVESGWDKVTDGVDAVLTLGLSVALDAYEEKKMEELEEELDLAFDTSLYFQGRADLEGGRYEEALVNFKRLEGYTSISKDFNLHWMYWFDYARTYLNLGDQEQAITTLRKSIEVIESQRTDFNSEMGKMGFSRGKQQPYEYMVNYLIEQGDFAEAFAYVERAKARALVDLMASREDISFGESDEAEQYLAQLNQFESRIQMGAESAPTNDTRGLVPKKQLKKKYPELASLISVDTLSSDEVGNLLKDGEVLVEYYLSEDKLYAFVLDGAQLNVYPLDSRNLDQNIRDFRTALNKPGKEWIKPSKALYRQLLRPFGKRIHNKDLIIVPHGPLHYLPFAALHDGRRFVVDKARIRFMPSASVMKYVGHNQNISDKILILGNPDLNNPETDLPGAEIEAQAIAGLWSSADVKLRSEATETTIKNDAANYGIFHLASHGIFNAETPLESSLLLAPDSYNDGHLTVAEIYGMSLNADLVTLSACETGLGDIVSGDDVVGLNRGFLYAGADSILSSLWPVEDKPTAYFMTSFYGYLKENEKVKALQLAQIKTRKKYPHPSRWAAFQLTGASD
ncbi:CHAT domain-containing protein [Vibrio hannami]|uniref:CHAT domain-containing protein n=1 Tax=Vibrio hannami TaxID=2717094 RepID=UPI0024108EE8|nr:CHAT domain-containing tetratricopeptide repeat protein [Vibrio hannami]MDG3088490.1 CHAT domain-containing protein [Vibrio hannami]